MIRKTAALLIVFTLLLSLMPAVYAEDAAFEPAGNTESAFFGFPFFMKLFSKPAQQQQPGDDPPDALTAACIPPPCLSLPCIPLPCIPPPCPPPCLFGSLTVTKTLCAPAGFDMCKQFEFTLRNAAGAVVGTAVIGNGGSATFNCLIPGKYTITESPADVADHDLTVTVSGAASENGGCVTVCHGEQTVSFTNTYVKHTGDLTITKNLCAPFHFDKCKEFTFTVRDANNAVAATATLKGGESTTVCGLDVGTYTITESDASVCGYCLKVEVSGAATSNGGCLTIARGTQGVVFTNIYKYKLPPVIFPCFPVCKPID